MNEYFIAAGILAFAIGLVHSIFGERLVFRRMRLTGFIPANGAPILREHHVRILWASWHLVTIMGWCIAATLFWLALPSSRHLAQSFVATTVVATMFASSILVFVGTKAKHPGWAGLLVAGILTAMGQYA